MTTDQEQAVKDWTATSERQQFPEFLRVESGNILGVKTWIGERQYGIVSKLTGYPSEHSKAEAFLAMECELLAKLKPEAKS